MIVWLLVPPDLFCDFELGHEVRFCGSDWFVKVVGVKRNDLSTELKLTVSCSMCLLHVCVIPGPSKVSDDVWRFFLLLRSGAYFKYMPNLIAALSETSCSEYWRSVEDVLTVVSHDYMGQIFHELCHNLLILFDENIRVLNRPYFFRHYVCTPQNDEALQTTKCTIQALRRGR